MTFFKNKILNRRFFKAIEAADCSAQNCTCDKIVLSKQVFDVFSKEEEKLSLIGRDKKYLICLDHVRAAILNFQFRINAQTKLLQKV